MFVLLDRTNLRPLARHDSYLAVAALAFIQFANVDASVFRCGDDGQYGPLDNKELKAIAANMGQPLKGHGRRDLIGPFRQLVEETPWLALPFTVEQLRAQACLINPDDARPYAFQPDADEPELLQTWHCEPNRNRPRWESQHWVHFSTKTHQIAHNGQLSEEQCNTTSAGAMLHPRNNRKPTQPENQEMATAKKAAKPAPAVKKTAAPAKPPKAPAAAKPPKAPKPEKAPKAPRIEANGVKRPQPGTTGDKIWSTADKLSAKKKSPATFDEVSAALPDVAEGSLRTGYQRWRKFNGLKGRLPKAE